ncbi:MAG: tetratricopeptide repeat protein [Thermodesulfobacteriota bacterium]
MAKKLTRKELLKGPDEFMTFSERAVSYVQDHTRAFVFAGVTVAVLILGYIGGSWYLDYKDRRGQEIYNQAYYALRNAEALGEKPEDPAVPADLFRKVSSEHRLARVSVLALPQLASLEFQEGRVGEAIELYRTFKEESRRDKAYVAMTDLAMAACLEAKGQYDDAIEGLRPITGDPESFLREQALVRLVRLHRLNGQPEKAREAHETLAGAFPESYFLSLTEGVLELDAP